MKYLIFVWTAVFAGCAADPGGQVDWQATEARLDAAAQKAKAAYCAQPYAVREAAHASAAVAAAAAAKNPQLATIPYLDPCLIPTATPESGQ